MYESKEQLLPEGNDFKHEEDPKFLIHWPLFLTHSEGVKTNYARFFLCINS